jgi:hypothetical protein
VVCGGHKGEGVEKKKRERESERVRERERDWAKTLPDWKIFLPIFYFVKCRP